MPTLREFLAAILPPDGLYCRVAIVDVAARQKFHKTIEALAADIEVCDRELEGTKGAVYHGCASYSARQRNGKHVRLVRSLWLDIEFGDPVDRHGNVLHTNRPAYPDAATCLSAIARFCKSVGLPPGIVVA